MSNAHTLTHLNLHSCRHEEWQKNSEKGKVSVIFTVISQRADRDSCTPRAACRRQIALVQVRFDVSVTVSVCVQGQVDPYPCSLDSRPYLWPFSCGMLLWLLGNYPNALVLCFSTITIILFFSPIARESIRALWCERKKVSVHKSLYSYRSLVSPYSFWPITTLHWCIHQQYIIQLYGSAERQRIKLRLRELKRNWIRNQTLNDEILYTWLPTGSIRTSQQELELVWSPEYSQD